MHSHHMTLATTKTATEMITEAEFTDISELFTSSPAENT